MRTDLRGTRELLLAALLLPLLAAVAEAQRTRPPIPEAKRVSPQPLFPASELRQDHAGTVVIEFSIDAKGRPRNIAVAQSASSAFDSGAKKAIKQARFVVTEAWIAAGGPAARYRASVVFALAPCGPPPQSADDTAIGICARRHEARTSGG